MSEVAELEPEAQTALVEDAKQGKHHDLATFKVSRPDKLKFIRYLLHQGASVRETCRLAQVSATTVCQVLADPEYGPPIAKQKARVTGLTKTLLLVGLERKLEAWTDPDAKPADVFDLKLLNDMAILADGGATARVEHTHTFMTPDSSATMRLLEGSAVTVPALNDGQKVSTGIGSDSQIIHAIAEVAASPGGPEAIGECEGMVADTEPPDVTPSV